MMNIKEKILKRIKGKYGVNLGADCFLLSGSYLIIEHLVKWGGFNNTFGHEHVGAILILTGLFLRYYSYIYILEDSK